MSESKQGGARLFRVVDRRGNVHVIQADSMYTTDDVVTFHRDGVRSEVASFKHSVGAVRVDESTYTEALNLVPGEVCMSAFQDVPLGLVRPIWLIGLALMVAAGLNAYELFWFAG